MLLFPSCCALKAHIVAQPGKKGNTHAHWKCVLSLPALCCNNSIAPIARQCWKRGSVTYSWVTFPFFASYLATLHRDSASSHSICDPWLARTTLPRSLHGSEGGQTNCKQPSFPLLLGAYQVCLFLAVISQALQAISQFNPNAITIVWCNCPNICI